MVLDLVIVITISILLKQELSSQRNKFWSNVTVSPYIHYSFLCVLVLQTWRLCTIVRRLSTCFSRDLCNSLQHLPIDIEQHPHMYPYFKIYFDASTILLKVFDSITFQVLQNIIHLSVFELYLYIFTSSSS